MLRDEFDLLLKLFNEAAEGKQTNLEEVFAQSLEFFKHLKNQMETGTPEDKQEAIKMMGELYAQMMAATKRITEKSGLSEEQLLSYAENSANFTPEQWAAIQDSRQKIAQAGKDLAKTVENQIKEGTPPAGKGKEEKDAHKKSKKSHWLRS